MSTQAPAAAPPAAQPAPCHRCGGPSTSRTTSALNRNGNANRPYIRCIPCRKFITFTDDRGLDPNNPPCGCGRPSRRQLTGRRKEVPRAIYFVCREGRCGFYMEYFDDEGERVVVPLGLMDVLIAHKIV